MEPYVLSPLPWSVEDEAPHVWTVRDADGRFVGQFSYEADALFAVHFANKAGDEDDNRPHPLPHGVREAEGEEGP